MNRLSDALTSFLKYPYVFRVTAVALSCSFLVPVADAQEAAPVVIDPQTQQQVELTRAYWNANVDIANRPIVCNHLAYNPDTDAYDRNIGTSTRTSSGFYRSGNGETIIHEPLVRASNGNASRGIIHHSYIPELEPTRATWTVENGVYIGNAFDAQEYLELVNYDPATTEITIGASNNAVRVWTQGQVRQGNSIYTVTNYSICYALDGMPFIPTGSAELGNNDLPTLDELNDFTFQFPQAIDIDATVPVIYRADTGEQVQFSRGEWAYNEQLALSGMHCFAYRWDENYQNYVQVPEFGGLSGRDRWFTTSYPVYFEGSLITTRTYWTTDYYAYQDEELISAESFQLFGGNPYMELTDYGFNLWQPPNSYSFYRCQVNAPKRVLPVQPGNCDYSTADQYDGYGWNPVARESCPPLEAPVTDTLVQSDACDYSAANQYGGYGWNPVTRESCPPLAVPVVETLAADLPNACIDTDGDGFGWNGVETCIPGGDEHRPNPDPSQACIDTDGDGYGWNGVETCTPDEGESPADPSLVCEDSDDDGFGWTGTQSCRFDEQGNIVIL